MDEDTISSSYPRFQWSIFTDIYKLSQYVVRSNDIADFLDGVEVIKSMLPEPVVKPATDATPTNTGNGAQTEDRNTTPLVQAGAEAVIDTCPLHNKPMKKRLRRDGSSFWYDHRWKETGPDGEEIWMRCDGENVKAG